MDRKTSLTSLLGLLLSIILAFLYRSFRISGECSRQEEAQGLTDHSEEE